MNFKRLLYDPLEDTFSKTPYQVLVVGTKVVTVSAPWASWALWQISRAAAAAPMAEGATAKKQAYKPPKAPAGIDQGLEFCQVPKTSELCALVPTSLLHPCCKLVGLKAASGL